MLTSLLHECRCHSRTGMQVPPLDEYVSTTTCCLQQSSKAQTPLKACQQVATHLRLSVPDVGLLRNVTSQRAGLVSPPAVSLPN